MKDTQFTGWWEGDVNYYCDECGKCVSIPFTDKEEANDYKEHKNVLRDKGWESTKVKGEWNDFCCEKCRNDYIRKHTR